MNYCRGVKFMWPCYYFYILIFQKFLLNAIMGGRKILWKSGNSFVNIFLLLFSLKGHQPPSSPLPSPLPPHVFICTRLVTIWLNTVSVRIPRCSASLITLLLPVPNWLPHAPMSRRAPLCDSPAFLIAVTHHPDTRAVTQWRL